MSFIWNQNKMCFVKLDSVRNFTISKQSIGYQILAWFNDQETLIIGEFPTAKEAQVYLEKKVSV